MYATADEALEGLRHKRTGALLPTKNVANNTKLIYFADELVGLQLHATIIALYKPNGVSIDVRGPASPTGEGWFTNVTWERLDRFTPVRSHSHEGLRRIRHKDAERGTSRLYAHGAHISPDGSCEIPLEPFIEREIERTIRTFSGRARRLADRTVKAWMEWEEPPDCCRAYESGDGLRMHYLDHLEAGEPIIPFAMHHWVNELRSQRGYYGDALLYELRAKTREWLNSFRTDAVKRLCPEFPYPQVERRRR